MVRTLTHPELIRFQEQIISAGNAKEKINIQGGNTKSWYGNSPIGNVLSTTAYQGVLDYQPEELVITVCAGTPLQEVVSTLAAKSQYFPFEPPHFGSSATIGGMVCAGLAGPGRGQAGSLRDYVLGAKMMDGTGEVLSFGGKVMKNVAGYDVSRLLPGSLGTLALLLEVSIKVLPIAAKTQTICFEMHQVLAIEQMNIWASQPLPLSATAWIGNADQGKLWVRLAGANAAVSAALSKMQGLFPSQLVEDHEAQAFWSMLREQTHPYFQLQENEQLWRFAINPLSPPLDLPGETIIEWCGGQRWHKGSLDRETAKLMAQSNQGHATLFRGAKSRQQVFTSLSEQSLTAPLLAVQERLRASFDPHHIFQTGRMS